jgi:hypothetical protein
MDLVKIISKSNFIYPSLDFQQTIFSENRVFKIGSIVDRIVTDKQFRTVDLDYLHSLPVRTKIYNRYELTIFATETTNLELFFLSEDVRVYTDGEIHHARNIEIDDGVEVSGTAHLKFVVNYSDYNTANYYSEPIIDHLISENIAQLYPNYYTLRLIYNKAIDQAYGLQTHTEALTGPMSNYTGGYWYFDVTSNPVTALLSVGDIVSISINDGQVTGEGVVIQTSGGIEVQSDITQSSLPISVNISFSWSEPIEIYSIIKPEKLYLQTELITTEIDGVKYPAKISGSDAIRTRFYMNQNEMLRVKKYLPLCTDSIGSVAIVETNGNVYTGVESITPDIEEIDTGLYQMALTMKYEHETHNIYE